MGMLIVAVDPDRKANCALPMRGHETWIGTCQRVVTTFAAAGALLLISHHNDSAMEGL